MSSSRHLILFPLPARLRPHSLHSPPLHLPPFCSSFPSSCLRPSPFSRLSCALPCRLGSKDGVISYPDVRPVFLEAYGHVTGMLVGE